MFFFIFLDKSNCDIFKLKIYLLAFSHVTSYLLLIGYLLPIKYPYITYIFINFLVIIPVKCFRIGFCLFHLKNVYCCFHIFFEVLAEQNDYFFFLNKIFTISSWSFLEKVSKNILYNLYNSGITKRKQ